jgi:hypothetical protein
LRGCHFGDAVGEIHRFPHQFSHWLLTDNSDGLCSLSVVCPQLEHWGIGGALEHFWSVFGEELEWTHESSRVESESDLYSTRLEAMSGAGMGLETISHVKALCKCLRAKRIGNGDHLRILIAFNRVSANSLLLDHSKVPTMMDIGKIQLLVPLHCASGSDLGCSDTM